jgi:hypothetical protein
VYDWSTNQLNDGDNLLEAIPLDAQSIFNVNNLKKTAEIDFYRFIVPNKDSSSILTWNLDAKDLDNMVQSFPYLQQWADSSKMVFFERENGNRVFVTKANTLVAEQFKYMVTENSMYLKNIIHFVHAKFWTQDNWIVFASEQQDIEDVIAVLKDKKKSILNDQNFKAIYKTTSKHSSANYFFKGEAWKKTFWAYNIDIYPRWIGFDLHTEQNTDFALKGFFTSEKVHPFIYKKNKTEFSNFLIPQTLFGNNAPFKVVLHENPDHFLYAYLSPYFIYTKEHKDRFLVFKIQKSLEDIPKITLEDVKKYLVKRLPAFIKTETTKKKIELYQDHNWLILGTKAWGKDLSENKNFLQSQENLILDYGLSVNLTHAENILIPRGKIANISTEIQTNDSLSYFINLYFKLIDQPKPPQAGVKIRQFKEREFVLINRQNKKKEIFKQDKSGNLTLESNKKKLWEIPFKAQIYGNIQQIDWFNNKKLQLFFSADDQLHLIDRKGKNVKPFPMQLQERCKTGAYAWQDIKKKKIRFLVPIRNQIHLYDRKGEVKNWETELFPSDIIHTPFTFSVGKKNYVFTLDTTGNVYLLNSNGKIAKRFSKFITTPSEIQNLRLEIGKTLKQSTIVVMYKNKQKKTLKLE